jgi:dienelactone hydrolase
MNNRRKFLKNTGLAGLTVAEGSLLKNLSSSPERAGSLDATIHQATAATGAVGNPVQEENRSIIGLYGPWAGGLTQKGLPALSFRRKDWPDLQAWRETARKRLAERLAIPEIGPTPPVTVQKKYTYDGLQVEELSWQLPYGRPTEAILLKPAGAKGKLPGILAFHDHGGNKYFGTRKITRTADRVHPMMETHQKQYYAGFAWANEMARRGYVVLVPDAFHFASRRVMLEDVPLALRGGLTDGGPENQGHIDAYNGWASAHEHIMAKSLFSAGTTWPGVFLAEDRKALDVLCARPDVDARRVGCGGLSGGGLRTVLMGGLDPRIACAVCVGFMTTWKDLVIHKSFTHTWMTYVPLLPNELDFPEMLGLRAPMPTLVLNNENDTLFTLSQMQQADTILREVYAKAGAESAYKCSFYPGPHKFDQKMQAEAYAWFDRWLKS